MMAKFRKKPVVIEAEQFRLDNRPAVLALAGDAIRLRGRVAFINTAEGEMRADDGDWIIRGIKGEFYPCKDQIFRATYEPVQE